MSEPAFTIVPNDSLKHRVEPQAVCPNCKRQVSVQRVGGEFRYAVHDTQAGGVRCWKSFKRWRGEG